MENDEPGHWVDGGAMTRLSRLVRRCGPATPFAAGLLPAGLMLAVVAGPLVYPAWLAARTRHRPEPTPPRAENLPSLSVVVPAYREHAVIAAKVDDVLVNGYPGGLEVLVVADDAPTASAARATGARVLTGHQRLGKAAALDRGVAAAAGDVIVMSDANTVLRPGSLANLARWFADDAVGAVAGEKRVQGDGEGAYWRYESWLKRRESRLGSTIGMVGELAAVRRAAWRPLPADVTVDDLWIALDAIEGGWRVVYEPEAIAVESAPDNAREAWERRTRIVAGTFDLLWRRRHLLVRRDVVAVQLWGHKLLRQSLGPLAHAALALLALRRARRSRGAAAVVAAHLVGAAAAVAQLTGRAVPRPLAVAGQVVFLQAVAIAGLLRYLRGERPAVWAKPQRPPGLPDVFAGRRDRDADRAVDRIDLDAGLRFGA